MLTGTHVFAHASTVIREPSVVCQNDAQGMELGLRRFRTLFVTQRGERHQAAAINAAPPELDIVLRRAPSKDEIISLVKDADFLVSERTGSIDADIIDAGHNLKLIQRLGSQTWDIDVAHARDRGIPVCSMPIQSCIYVAEHTVLQILAMNRRARELFEITDRAADWGKPQRCNENYFAFNWSKRTDIRGIWGATIGILGFGEIGTEVARRLKGYGCEVLYSKRTPLPRSVENELGIRHVSIHEMATRSDVVACLLPNLPENNQIIGADFFAKMKPRSLFAHCGAPGVVVEDALIEALTSGHLSGAALDCFTYEPLRNNDPLLQFARCATRNLLLTPHIAAGVTSANSDERVRDFDNLTAAILDKPLRHQL